MLSVSFMQPGEASTYAAAAAARASDARQLPRAVRARAAWAATSLNSLARRDARHAALAACSTSLAGYAFAKLRFAGRDRIFRGLLGALVIPAQVAMMPLFLMLK